MSKEVNVTTNDESKVTSNGEFNIEFSLWKVKVFSKGFSPEDFGKMMKEALGWRNSLFWIIVITGVVGVLFHLFKPTIIDFLN